MINMKLNTGLGEAGGWDGREYRFSFNDIGNICSSLEFMGIHFYYLYNLIITFLVCDNY